MKKSMVSMIVGIVFMMMPLMAIGASVTGSIQGFSCVTQGKVCPIGMEDPMIAAENVFVVLVNAATGEYYFVPNLDRAILARHINEQVKVEGNIDKNLKSIHAKSLYALDAKDNWKKVWDVDTQDQIYKSVFDPSLR